MTSGPTPFTVIDGGTPEHLHAVAARVHDRLLDDLDAGALDRIPREEARAHVEAAVANVLAEIAPDLSGASRRAVVLEVSSEIVGFGPIQPLLDDPDLTEVMVNGPNEVFFERAGVLYASAACFRDERHIRPHRRPHRRPARPPPR